MIPTHRLSGRRPEVRDDAREGLADPAAPAQVTAAAARQLLPPPLLGLPLNSNIDVEGNCVILPAEAK